MFGGVDSFQMNGLHTVSTSKYNIQRTAKQESFQSVTVHATVMHGMLPDALYIGREGTHLKRW